MENSEEPKRWPILERPLVAIPLTALGAACIVAAAFAIAGHPLIAAVHTKFFLVGALVFFMLGWRWFRDTWTLVMSTFALGLVYVLGVGVMSLAGRLVGQDALDLRKPKPSMWRTRAPMTPDELQVVVSRQF